MNWLNTSLIKYIVLHEGGCEGAHHWSIDRDGTLHVGVSITCQAEHCPGLDDRSVSICLAGDGDAESPSPEQVETLIDLCAKLHRWYLVEPANLLAHREVNSLVAGGILPAKYAMMSFCPGRRVYLPRLRRLFHDCIRPPPPNDALAA